jgi:hypothetical protein
MQELLAHDLLREAAPDELEVFPHYVGAATNAGRLGPEFGIEEAASVGPTVVARHVLISATAVLGGRCPSQNRRGILCPPRLACNASSRSFNI